MSAQEPRVANLSTRAHAGVAADTLTSGFVISPGASKAVLIRAIGPSLAPFGLSGLLADPILTIFNASGVAVAANDNWLSPDAATMTAVGAFPLSAGSRDAALVATLAPGNYTAQVSGNGATTGLALLEIYEVGSSGTKLVNLSTRAQVGAGAGIMIPGLVIAPGAGARRVLMRAAGPALANFGLSGTLVDPILTLVNGAGATVASNDNWSTSSTTTAATLAASFTAAGAFGFAANSRDSALVADLPAGTYSIQISGVGGATGLALVEVYDITGLTLATATDEVLGGDYLTLAANGEKIRHPAVAKTYAVMDGGRSLQIPENMVYVPGGSFTYGTGATAENVTLEGYAIGKYEVTNAEWKAFLDATSSRTFPTHWTSGQYPAGKAAHPVLYVSLTSAQAYCTWVSQRTGWAVSIPTAQQWEKAARGPNAYQFPWGNTLDASYNASTGALTSRCNFNAVVAAYYLRNFPDQAVTYNDSHSPYYGTKTTVSSIAGYAANGAATPFAITATGSVSGWVNHDTYTGFIYTDLFDSLNAVGGTTTPVGSFENEKSAYGCYDMAGNVWEWTTTLITATNGAEAGQSVNEVRGGSWYATGNSCRVIAIGEGRAASGVFNTIGFRVVMAPR